MMLVMRRVLTMALRINRAQPWRTFARRGGAPFSAQKKSQSGPVPADDAGEHADSGKVDVELEREIEQGIKERHAKGKSEMEIFDELVGPSQKKPKAQTRSTRKMRIQGGSGVSLKVRLSDATSGDRTRTRCRTRIS